MSVSERVRALVEPVIVPLGLELVDVEHVGSTLRVSVDRPGGVDLDAISAASEAVSAVLDRAALLDAQGSDVNASEQRVELIKQKYE